MAVAGWAGAEEGSGSRTRTPGRLGEQEAAAFDLTKLCPLAPLDIGRGLGRRALGTMEEGQGTLSPVGWELREPRASTSGWNPTEAGFCAFWTQGLQTAT